MPGSGVTANVPTPAFEHFPWTTSYNTQFKTRCVRCWLAPVGFPHYCSKASRSIADFSLHWATIHFFACLLHPNQSNRHEPVLVEFPRNAEYALRVVRVPSQCIHRAYHQVSILFLGPVDSRKGNSGKECGNRTHRSFEHLLPPSYFHTLHVVRPEMISDVAGTARQY